MTMRIRNLETIAKYTKSKKQPQQTPDSFPFSEMWEKQKTFDNIYQIWFFGQMP